MRVRILFVIAVGLLLTTAVHAQRNTLKEGAEAPGFDVEKWVAGPEIAIEPERVFVIEFFETTCRPCIKSLQILNAVQEVFERDVRVVAISGEDEAVVSRFAHRNSDALKFSMAVDRRNGTSRAWVKKAGRDDLPVTFIVDKQGRIQYIGSTADEEFLPILKLVVTGRFDHKLYTENRPALIAARNARKQRNWRLAAKLLDDIVEKDKRIFADIALLKFEMMIGRDDMNEPAPAYEFARTLLVTYAEDPNLLADLARKIVTDPKIPDENRDYALALEAAEKAALHIVATDPDRFHIQALVHYHAGRYDEAIRLQKKAYFLARPFEKEIYQRDLNRYREAQRRAETAQTNVK